MTQKELAVLEPEKRVAWFNRLSPIAKWKAGEDVFCLACDGLFKAEDVVCDKMGYPACPICQAGSPIEFAALPWWREDLTEEAEPVRGMPQYRWAGPPLKAEAGKPRKLPKGG
jgi:hypothetical protein